MALQVAAPPSFALPGGVGQPSVLRIGGDARPQAAGSTIETVRPDACMREIVFRVLEERPAHLRARSDDGLLEITAGSLEELHLEAREAVMRQRGPAHVAFRIRLTRQVGSRPARRSQAHVLGPAAICPG